MISITRALIDSLSGSGKRYIAVLEIYLDESGTHRGANLLCVAGYVGNRKEWYSFEKEWGERLGGFDVSCFHAKNPNCKFLKGHLTSAIETRNLTGFACAVRPEIFNLHASAHFKSKLGNAYSACTISITKEIFKWTRKNKLGPISFFIEDGQPNAKFVERTLKLLLNDRDFPVAGVMLGRKDEFMPLQTADFLAHSYGVKDQPWLHLLTRHGKVYHAEMTPEQLIESSKEIKRLINLHRNLRRKAKREITDPES